MTQTEMPTDGKHQPVTIQQFNSLVKTMTEKRGEVEQLKAQLSEKNAELEKLQAKAVEYLDGLGQNNFKTPFGTVYKVERSSVALPQTPEDREAFFAWLREKQLFDQTISVHSAKLNALYKAELEAAEARGEGFDFKIPGIKEPQTFVTLGFRKGE